MAPPGVGPRVTLVHRTAYAYARAIMLGPQTLRLRPLPDPRAPLPAYRLLIHPPPLGVHWLTDPLGNQVARFTLPGPVERLSIEVTLGLDLSPRNPFDFMMEPAAARWPFHYAVEDADALAAFRRADHAGPALLALREETQGQWDTVALLTALGARVRDRLTYVVRLEHGTWPSERTLAEGRGSCRDFAWLLVQLLRMHGIAARFVSGYLVQFAEQPPGAASAELHAWAEAYLPGAGWVGIDATSGYLTGQNHVPLAAGADPIGAAPLAGTMEPAESRLDTGIEVHVAP